MSTAFEWSIKLLYPYVKDIDAANELLLFPPRVAQLENHEMESFQPSLHALPIEPPFIFENYPAKT